MVPPVGSSRTRDASTAISGVVLAGGASSRFGRDKALEELDGESLAERARRKLAAVCADVVVADAGRALLAGVESVADGPGRGPIAGILGAAALRPRRALLVLACDLPHVPAALLERIAAAEGDWVVPRWANGVEPLCALYRAPALDALERRARAGDYALHGLEHAGLRVRHLEGDELSELGDPARLFWNVNLPEDLARLRPAP